MDAPNVIELGKSRFSGAYLRSVSEAMAIKSLHLYAKNQVINAWKQANGLTKPNRLAKKETPETED